MNAVVYYSETGNSKSIANYLSNLLDFPAVDIYNAKYRYDDLVIVFPVHCQNIPAVVRSFIKNLSVKTLSVVATYGGVWHGNVLYELQHKYCFPIIAGVYLPSTHSYMPQNKIPIDYNSLNILKTKLADPSPVRIPHSFKNPFAGFFDKQRSQLGVKISKTSDCTNCGECEKACMHNAICNGITNKNCIRCLRCIRACNHNALTFSLRYTMRKYLDKPRAPKTKIYV